MRGNHLETSLGNHEPKDSTQDKHSASSLPEKDFSKPCVWGWVAQLFKTSVHFGRLCCLPLAGDHLFCLALLWRRKERRGSTSWIWWDVPRILAFKQWDEEFKDRLGYVTSQLKLHETLSQKEKGGGKKGKKEAKWILWKLKSASRHVGWWLLSAYTFHKCGRLGYPWFMHWCCHKMSTSGMLHAGGFLSYVPLLRMCLVLAVATSLVAVIKHPASSNFRKGSARWFSG